MTPREAIPRSWTDHLKGGIIGIGKDLGTTTNKKSNPSSITVIEKIGRIYFTRLVVAFKTDDPDVSEAMLKVVLDDIKQAAKCRRICLDASNEVFFATRLKKNFIKYCPVSLIKGGENIEYRGESMSSKELLGNLYINTFDDELMTLPLADWLRDDHRLVLRDRGSFTTNTSRTGQHGDTFDSGKLAVYAIIKGGGRIQASAAAVGSTGSKPKRRGIFGPIGKKFLGRKINN